MNARQNGNKKNCNNNLKIRRGVTPCLFGLFTLLSEIFSPAFAADVPVETNTRAFTLKLGATRVIYDPASSGATLAVINQQGYPILVRSQVFAEDKTSPAPFVVTPPLFRLDAQQQSRLRIVRTGGQLVSDRETLNWLCVTGIPPQADDAWAKDPQGKSAAPTTANLNVQISMQNCIKLFVRPARLGDPITAGAALSWTRKGDQLTAKNTSPFYINLRTVSVGGKAVDNLTHIAPFASHSFPLPKGASGTVEWRVITDLGGESRAFTAPLS